MQADTDRSACVAAPHRTSHPPPAKGRSPQLLPCTGKVASAGAGQLRRATRPAAGHARAPPPPTPTPPPQPHTTRPPPTTTRPEERRTSCRQQPAPPLRDAAKMSPRISIGPEPVLAAHAPFPPSAGSHCDRPHTHWRRYLYISSILRRPGPYASKVEALGRFEDYVVPERRPSWHHRACTVLVPAENKHKRLSVLIVCLQTRGR